LAADLLRRLLTALSEFVKEALQVYVEIANMRTGSFIETAHPVARHLDEPRQCGTELHLALGQLDHEVLVRAHLVAQGRQTLGQGEQVAVALLPALFAARQSPLQVLEAVGGLFEQRLEVSRDGLFAIADRTAAAQSRDARQPFLKILEEAIVCLLRLQFQESQDQRSGKAEERGAEGSAHSGERLLHPVLELGEHLGHVGAADRERTDCIPDRRHCLQKAPERAEQSEEKQEADQVWAGLL